MAARRLALVTVLLVLSLMTTVQSSAFKITGVNNSSSLIVGQSDVAGLAVGASSGNSAYAVTYVGGQVQVHFGKGNSGTVYSLQTTRTQSNLTVVPDTLKMLNVLNVTNNSGYCQDVAVWVSAGSAVNLTNIYGRPTGGAQPGTALNSPTNTLKVQPGGTMVVDFWWTATSTVTTSGTFTLTVKGTKSASCP